MLKFINPHSKSLIYSEISLFPAFRNTLLFYADPPSATPKKQQSAIDNSNTLLGSKFIKEFEYDNPLFTGEYKPPPLQDISLTAPESKPIKYLSDEDFNPMSKLEWSKLSLSVSNAIKNGEDPTPLLDPNILFPTNTKKFCPEPEGETVETFLTKIGKNSISIADKFSDWNDLMVSDASELKDRGLTVKQRRWILNRRHKFKLGEGWEHHRVKTRVSLNVKRRRLQLAKQEMSLRRFLTLRGKEDFTVDLGSQAGRREWWRPGEKRSKPLKSKAARGIR